MAGKVTVIPSTINPRTRLPETNIKKRRVAAYARVSTDSDEQYTSFEAQTDHYTKFIKGNPSWEFAGLYTDEGISGTNTKHREGFNSMIEDALAGKIDLIVTKSVSRFARNTVDSLTTIRKLKENGTEVFFEKENIWTFDGKGELLLTIMSSLAQEESRSISENVTWGQRKRFSDGKVSMPYKAFLGYEKGENGVPVINEEQAQLVRRIYSSYMRGLGTQAIAKQLTKEGIPTPRGGDTWSSSTIRSILSNEKYKGSALLQKCFTVDFLTHKTKKNEGEVPKYYIEKSHEAIIPPEEWEAVQAEIRRRKEIGRAYSTSSIFASKFICDNCGAFYGSKIWHSTDKYRHVVWQCNGKYKGDHKCKTPNLSEEEIMKGFVRAYNQVYDDRENIIADCKFAKKTMTDTSIIVAEMTEMAAETETVSHLINELIAENTEGTHDQEVYDIKYNALCERFETASRRHSDLEAEKKRKEAQAKTIDRFITMLRSRTESITEFDEDLWIACIENVRVREDGTLVFLFRSGLRREINRKDL